MAHVFAFIHAYNRRVKLETTVSLGRTPSGNVLESTGPCKAYRNPPLTRKKKVQAAPPRPPADSPCG